MATDTPRPARFPLLETVLAHKGLPLKGTYTVRDVADLFAVSTRTIQLWMKRGDVSTRDLPGRAKFLATDLEQLLECSQKKGDAAA